MTESFRKRSIKPFEILSMIVFLMISIRLTSGCLRHTVLPMDIQATVLLPAGSGATDGVRFIPADTVLPLVIRLEKNGVIPPGCNLVVRTVDSGGREYAKRVWPLSVLAGSKTEILKLYRITGLPGSRPIRIQAGVCDTDGKWYRTGFDDRVIWHNLASGYALHRTVSWSRGWYPPESGDRFMRGCDGKGVLHLSRPAFPEVLRIRGTAPVRCFDARQWNLAIASGNRILLQKTVETDTFDAAVMIDAASERTGCHSADEPWPAGELACSVTSDRTFDPYICQGMDDKRVLAFHLTSLETGDFVPDKGFYGPREPDHHYWPAPNASVLLPMPADDTMLHIQGRRDTTCMELPQSMTLILSGQNLGSFLLDSEDFFVSIPCQPPMDVPGSTLELNIVVSPIFFRTGCMDTDDPRPYGVGIEEISFRSFRPPSRADNPVSLP